MILLHSELMHCISPPSSPCTSHLFVLPWILYLLKRTRQIDQYSNSIFQTYFCPNSIFRPRAVHIFSLEQGNRRILTLIEFYWISSFPAWALGAPLKQKPISVHLLFWGHIHVDFIFIIVSCIMHISWKQYHTSYESIWITKCENIFWHDFCDKM